MTSLVADLRAREAAARTIQLQLITEGRLPGGLEFSTRGTLRVLRAAQGGITAVQASVDYTFADGLAGHMDTVKTPEGVLIYEQAPTAGEVYVRMDKSVVADVEWAGAILQRSDLPGLGDARATAPLGSAMVADLALRYDLAELSHKDKDGQLGTWYGGDRRPGPGIEGEDPDVPLADHVELFVGEGDHALLAVDYLQAGKVVQRIRADHVVVDAPMPLESFKLDDKGKRPRDVKDHAPMWQQIEDLLARAQAKATEQRAAGTLPEGEDVPPSRRPAKK